MTKAFVVGNRIEHLGDWDFQEYELDVCVNPWAGDGEAPENWDYGYRTEMVIGNPIPPGAMEIDAEITETAKGRLVLASDWHALREDAYPPIKDQLDAQWKGGAALEEMADIIKTIKEKYPKTEADQ